MGVCGGLGGRCPLRFVLRSPRGVLDLLLFLSRNPHVAASYRFSKSGPSVGSGALTSSACGSSGVCGVAVHGCDSTMGRIERELLVARSIVVCVMRFALACYGREGVGLACGEVGGQS